MTQTIKIYGDKYIIKKTYDINEFGFGIYYGCEVYNDNKRFQNVSEI